MCNLVSVDHNSLAIHLTRNGCVNGFKKCCTYSADDDDDDNGGGGGGGGGGGDDDDDDDDDDMLSEGSEEDGMVVVSVRKIEALILKMETVRLIGKGGQNTTCVVYFSI